MTNLSQALKKYYSKEGNKIVFKNKYSLNQLALEMWDRLGYQGIDASTLSRVINGHRIFTKEQVDVFCETLNLKIYEKRGLFEAQEQDYLKKLGFAPHSTNQSIFDLINLLKISCDQFRYARERSHFVFVNDWSEIITTKIRQCLKKDMSFSIKNELLEILSSILYEKGFVSCSTLLPENNMLIIRPLFNEMLSISKECRSKKILIKAYDKLGFAYYALGNYSYSREARKFYTKSLNLTNKALKIIDTEGIDDEFYLIFWRYMAMNNIYLSDKYLFNIADDKILKFLNKCNQNYSYSIIALHTLARGQSHFGNKNALSIIKQSQIREKTLPWKDPLRKVCMIKNEIEVINNLKMRTTSHTEKLINEGLVLSKNFGIHRFEVFFQQAAKFI